MGKRILQLYVDDETIQLAKAKQINMSALFRSMLRCEIKLDDTKNPLEKLKLMNAKLSSELEKIKKLLDKANKKLGDKQMEAEGWHKPNQKT